MAKGFWSSPSGWSTKQYIAAALAGTIVVTAIVIVVSIVLQPAHIVFTVTRTCVTPAVLQSGQQWMVLNLTLVANNTSIWHTKVRYRYVTVILLSNLTQTLPVQVEESLKSDQPPGSTTRMNASVRLTGPLSDLLLKQMNSRGRIGSAPVINARVTASVRFKVGVAITRTYTIVVTCKELDFFNTSTVNCNP